MTATESITDVVFRVWTKDEPVEVFALMPGLAGTNDPNTCTSYAHIGQHSSADPLLCMRSSRPATPEEYKPLLNELQQRGYLVNVVKRCTRRHREERIKQL